jgi:TonB family protein
LSLVFDARRNAEQLKRAPKANAEGSGAPALPQQAPSSVYPESADVPKQDPQPRGPAVWNVASVTTEGPDKKPLGLTVDRRGADWRLRWNGNLPSDATCGRLSIADGTVEKSFDLDLTSLQNGCFFYTPAANDVVLRLEIRGDNSAVLQAESIRMVAGNLPLAPLQAQTMKAGPGNEQKSAQPARSEPAWSPGIGIVRSLLRVASSPRPAVASSAPAQGRRARIEPATLTFRKEPVYPVSAKQSQISGNVEVQFRISPQGRVYGAKSMKGSEVLAQAAIEAVTEWCYEPARLNGIPIDSQASTDFTFELHQ